MSRKPKSGAAWESEHFVLEGVDPEDGGWRATVSVAEGSRWFDGHFPDAPILPGVGQVDLVSRLYERLVGEASAGKPWPGGDGAEAGQAGSAMAGEGGEGGEGVTWSGLPKLRLSGQVEPGQRLEVTLRPGAGGVTFHIHGAGTADGGAGARICDGLLAFGPPSDGDPPGHESPTRRAGVEAMDPATLLPHQPPSLLALEIVGFDDGGEDALPALLCRGRVPEDHAAADSGPVGQAGTWMAIELAAQASGLLEAAIHRAAGTDLETLPVGYLVRVRDAHFAHPTLPLAADLLTRVELAGRAGPLNLYRATVGVPGSFALATASLGTFVPEDPQ